MLLFDPKPSLLAVLDDSERSALLKLSLVARGWDVVRAHSCEQARARFGEQHVDALLMDLVLPDGSAFGLLRSLTSRPLVAAVLTWGNQRGIRDRIVSSGFDLHIVRPTTAEDIDRELRRAMSSKLPLSSGPCARGRGQAKPSETHHLFSRSQER
jgi:DNA-binding response OmpR family regulator